MTQSSAENGLLILTLIPLQLWAGYASVSVKYYCVTNTANLIY